MTNWSCKTKKR